MSWKRNRLAGYLSNYIRKAFDPESFTVRHRYRCSKHIEIVKRVFYLPYANGMEALLIRDIITNVARHAKYQHHSTAASGHSPYTKTTIFLVVLKGDYRLLPVV
ncbi:MAG: hypothetical protein ABFS24_08535 [Pseudomonadota bacterium]